MIHLRADALLALVFAAHSRKRKYARRACVFTIRYIVIWEMKMRLSQQRKLEWLAQVGPKVSKLTGLSSFDAEWSSAVADERPPTGNHPRRMVRFSSEAKNTRNAAHAVGAALGRGGLRIKRLLERAASSRGAREKSASALTVWTPS
jgi:hypothetical protein